MSRENVEIVREVMAFWERARESGEPPPHTNLLAPDFEIDMSRRVFNPAVYRGVDGLARLNEEIRDVWEEFRSVPEQFIDAGDRVVVIVTSHARGQGSGVELETGTYATIWTVRDGQVTRVQVGVDPSEALKAVGPAMSEECTTPDLVERWRQASEAAERGEFDAVMSVYAPDAVWDASVPGVGTFEGKAAIRSFLEDWIGDYEEYEYRQEEGIDLGSGVVFVVGRVDGHPAGSTGRVQERWAFTSVWVAGMIRRVTVGNDIDEARAAAERVAEERG